MNQPTIQELGTHGGFKIDYIVPGPDSPSEHGLVSCNSKLIPVHMSVYQKPESFYGLHWPTPIHDPREVTDVVRRATDKSGSKEFTCISWKPEDEDGPEIDDWRDGETLDEVLMFEQMHLLRGNADDRSLLWERGFEWPVKPEDISFAWLATLSPNAEPIREVVEETIDPVHRSAVGVALDSLTAIFQKYRDPASVNIQ